MSTAQFRPAPPEVPCWLRNERFKCLRRIAVTVLVVALLALREYHSLANPQLWAEDGGVFFIQAYIGHPWRILLEPYQGYFHLLPRLIAATGQGIPLSAIPAFYAWSALFVTGVSAWTIQSPRMRFPATWAAALAIAVVPHTGEVYLAICNLQWITAIALFVLTLEEDAKTWAQRAGDTVLLLITALTGPFVVMAVPFFIWRAWTKRTAWSTFLLALAMGCAAAVAPFLLHSHGYDNPVPLSPLNMRLATIIGRRLMVDVFASGMNPSEFISAVLAIAIPTAIAAAIFKKRQLLAHGYGLLIASLVILAAAAYKTRMDTWSYDDLTNGDRYFFFPKVIFVWLVAALALIHKGPVRYSLISVFVAAAFLAAPRFIFPFQPDMCWLRYSERLEQGEATVVPILPVGFSFGYSGRQRFSDD